MVLLLHLEELTEESESKRPSVQIGDPFVGKINGSNT